MTYDLFFYPRGNRPTEPELLSWFTDRRHHALRGSQSLYRNDDTGALFLFDLGLQLADDLDEEEASPPQRRNDDGPCAAFHMNVLGPHAFALEAAAEVQAFCSAFALLVDDPQAHAGDPKAQDAGSSTPDAKDADPQAPDPGVAELEPFSPQAFVERWRQSNRAAVRALLERGDLLVAAPTAQIERAWHWNFARAELQQQVGRELFVPRIVWVRSAQGIGSATVWKDAKPVVLPRTDLIVLERDALAPRRFLRRARDLTIASWQEVEPLLGRARRAEHPLEHWFLEGPPPAARVDWFLARPVLREPMEALSAAHVLNEEVVRELTQAGG